MEWMAAQLIARHRPGALRLGRGQFSAEVNPRPAGLIQEGSATHAVLVFLLANPKRWYTHREIVVGTKRTDKATSWALLYLRTLGLADVGSDAHRNSRYLRYRYGKGTVAIR